MESPGLTKMMIERLPVVVSEAEIRKLIRSDCLPRPAHIVLSKTSDSATAILHFQTLLDALVFRNKKNGKFLSSKTNITVQAAPIITSTILQQPPRNSDPVEVSKTGAVETDANICDNEVRDLLLDALKFKKMRDAIASNKKKEKFMSTKTNTTDQASSIITSTNFWQPLINSAPVEVNKKGAVKTEANICDNEARDELNTNITIKDERST